MTAPTQSTTESDDGNNRRLSESRTSKCPFAGLQSTDAAGVFQGRSVATDASVMPSVASEDETLVPSSPDVHRRTLKQAIEQCPAFRKPNKSSVAFVSETGTASCPFANVRTSDELQNVLVEVPESHWQQKDGVFVQTLQHFHASVRQQQQQQHLSADQSNSPSAHPSVSLQSQHSGPNAAGKAVWNTCPVKQRLADTGTFDFSEKGSFSDIMDDYSLMAIMAKIVEQNERTTNNPNSHPPRDNIDGIGIGDRSRAHDIVEDHERSVVSSDTTTGAPVSTDTQSNAPRRTARRLSQALQTGTKVSHEMAEDVHFVRNFIKGIIDRQLYAHYVWNYYHVYKTLEECCDRHAHKHFPNLHFPKQLYRTSALREDVDFWIGWNDANVDDPDTWPLPISPATQDYIDRLRHIADTDPVLLLSHAYTRYLGDLSGGKVLARIAKRALNLDKHSGEGLAFYQFEHIPSFKVFKDHYRAALDQLQTDEATMTQFVHEANVAFGLNVRIFEELDVRGGVVGATVRPLQEVYKVADIAVGWNGHTTPNDESDSAECPFLKRKTEASQEGTATTKGECPWPFLLLHDPARGMKKWQTWAVVGWIMAWMYAKLVVGA